MNFKHINAIFIKELQDIRTNWNQLLLYLLPLTMTLLFCKVLPSNEVPKGMSIGMGLLMLVIVAGITTTAMQLAEEKEKRTLEVLLLSPATTKEIFIGKSMVTFLSIIICMFILMLIDNNSWNNLPVILLSTVLISIFLIIFGLITGIFSKNQMSTGILGTPLTFFFMMPPLFSVLGVNQLEGIAKILPTYYYLDILKKIIYEGKAVQYTFINFGILLGSIVIAMILLLIAVKKKGYE